MNFTNETVHSTEKAESIEGAPRPWNQLHQLLGQAERQPTKPFDVVRSTCTAMQNCVPRNQAVARRNLKDHRLRVTRVLCAMALGAHGRGVGGKSQPEFPAGDVHTSSIICR